MPILDLRILPPLAIARFGSSATPLEAYELAVEESDPLGFRRIIPRETLEIDEASGAVARQYTPERIRFRDGEHIRPVAPFLEVYAQTSHDVLEPLTLDLLDAEGLGPDSVRWKVTVANLKVFRQTGDEKDKVIAGPVEFNDHDIHELLGRGDNFMPGKSISFGKVRYIRSTKEFPEVRLRFTPAAGKVYGASLTRREVGKVDPVPDPVFDGDESRIVYDGARGDWLNFQSDFTRPTLTNPSDIYQGYVPDPNRLAVSWGYLDDVCDGPVTVELTTRDGKTLTARAWISAGMPAFAPDSQPIRTVADELEQLILGPEIDDEEVSIEAAAEIIRRALETIRLMNTLVMNGNDIHGRSNIAHTLITQDTNDYGRLYAPIMASSLVDNLAVRALHERIYSALRSGTAPWFAEVLRRPEEIGDLSDKARRKMPPMLRGADGRALALTRRQISKVVKAATAGLFRDGSQSEDHT
jgi:hypothetical protein